MLLLLISYCASFRNLTLSLVSMLRNKIVYIGLVLSVVLGIHWGSWSVSPGDDEGLPHLQHHEVSTEITCIVQIRDVSNGLDGVLASYMSFQSLRL